MIASSSNLASLPPAERYDHGTRARYVTGCHCAPCRAANNAYVKARYRARKLRGDWNGLVSTARSVAHIGELRRTGIGLRAIAFASKVPRSTLTLIVAGTRKNIRASNEAAILAVDRTARIGVELVPAGPTWKLIRELLRTGMTRSEIAAALGSTAKVPALQLKRSHVTARNVAAVARLWRETTEQIAAEAGIAKVCPDCGYSHAPADRQRRIKRLVDIEPAEIIDAWPCFYGNGETGYRMLMRDLGAVRSAA